MIIKPGVSLLGVTERTMFGMRVVETVWIYKFGSLDFMITAGSENAFNPKIHGPKSKHRSGDALDHGTKLVRTLYETEEAARRVLEEMHREVYGALGGDQSEFDYVLEWSPWVGHLEWDPERRRS